MFAVNIILRSCAMGLQITNGTGLARQLQGNAQATLPPGIAVVSATLASLTAPRFTHYFSKRVLFMVASTSGIIGGGLLCIAGWKRSFALLCISGAPQGFAYGISNLYRFFAVDTTMPQHRDRALAAVVGGAVLSALMGPEAGRHLRLSLDQEFLGPFILSMCLWAAQVTPLQLRLSNLPCERNVPAATAARMRLPLTPPTRTPAMHCRILFCGRRFQSFCCTSCGDAFACVAPSPCS